MRSPRLLTGAALSAAALGLTTTAAFAGDFGTVEATPAPALPGSTVTLSTKDCGTGHSARVDAGTLGAGEITLTPAAAKGTLVGELTIKAGTEQGNYGIGGTCDNGKEITGTVDVGRAGETGRDASASGATGGDTGTPTHPGGVGKEAAGGVRSKAAAGESTAEGTAPRGATATGTGGPGRGSGGEFAAGAGALLVAAVGCARIARHRRADDRA